jgi:hypothetical protein
MPWYRDGCELELDDCLGQVGDDPYVKHLHDHETFTADIGQMVSPFAGYVFRYCRSCGVHLAHDPAEEARGTCAYCHANAVPMNLEEVEMIDVSAGGEGID